MTNHPESRIPATLDDKFEAIDRDIGGFGGMFYDQSGRPVIYLKPGVALTQAVASVRTHLPGTRDLTGPVTVLPARYNYAELTAWRELVTSDGIDRSGLVFDDIDERVNRLSFGVASAEFATQMERALMDQGVPKEALSFQVTARARLTSQTLQDTINPTMGGIYIRADTTSGCSLGFNVKWNGVMHFVTNSHCTSNVATTPSSPYAYPWMGVVTGVLFCQRGCPDSTTFPGFVSKLGPEVLDPPFQNTPGYWGTLCASDELCRMSDAAMVRYDYRIPTRFEIAGGTATTPPTPPDFLGSITVVGEVIGNNQAVGTWALRVGATTGSNFGQITQTCFHVRTYPRPGGKMLKLVCQNEMSNQAQSGDSGGPIYYAGFDGAMLYGIGWGARVGYTWYSPINNIKTDFGVFYSWQTY